MLAERGSPPLNPWAKKRVFYRVPEELPPDEVEQLDRVMDVDGEAYLRWLAGEGPDPCLPERSE